MKKKKKLWVQVKTWKSWLETKQNVSAMGLGKHWNRLPQEAVESPFVEILRALLHEALSSLI